MPKIKTLHDAALFGEINAVKGFISAGVAGVYIFKLIGVIS